MSDLEEELLGLAEDDPHRRKKKSKSKSKSYIVDSDEEGEEEMDMDMDMDDSDDDDGPSVPPPRAVNKNPYPLEGKYIDEDDRDALDALPEIERESILATRLEEMQKFRDSQQLDMMYRLAGADDDDDDEPGRKRRKHTSVTKEASRAIKDLKSKRKAHDERAQRRAARRERKARSRSPATDSQTEDGEISKYDSFRHSPVPSPPRKTAKERNEGDQEDIDATAAGVAELNGARVSRYELVDMMFKEGFEEVMTGAYVRLMAKETDPMGRPKYRINKIVSIDDQSDKHGTYSIEYKGRNVVDGRALTCQYGKATRMYRIADVSNGDFEQGEFTRLEMTNRADGVKPPKRSDLLKKHKAIKALRERPMTNEEINRQVEARKMSNPGVQRSKTLIQISQLIASRSLALRRNDMALADQLESEIIELGGDPTTGQLVSSSQGSASASQGAGEKEDYDAKIQRINEHKARKNKEAMAAAHLASIKRKKAEEAIVRARQANSNSPAPTVVPKPAPPPASGLKKGETPQQYVARTIDLDLGDF
ncbi:rtf1 protein [Papiliotrema laurentii]|uniref:Rtf1 protein n=1 Tax=Papiliotrema laurentii TaxID=5418 RepID=A0AAD9FQD6_PAPLA|nr:rtf1 protein [Papiliotrema laurentii]